MRNMDTVFDKRVARPEYQQRTVVTASGSEKAFDQANKNLGTGMSWVAGLSMLYLLMHLLRWVSNG
jgi:hypothetical protein